MAFSDDIFLPDDQCEICGTELAAEVVIQEFADGSIARLCAECAAGAALQRSGDDFKFPDASFPDASLSDASLSDAADVTEVVPPQAAAEVVAAADAIDPPADAPASSVSPDVLEKTRELLTPMVDLLALQQDMQGALQRLAASLQTFAAGVMTENVDKSASMESRMQALEAELQTTRARLREAEALLAAGAVAAQPAVAAEQPAEAVAQPIAEAAAPVALEEEVAPAPDVEPAPSPAEDAAAAAQTIVAPSLWDFDATMEHTAETPDVDLDATVATPPLAPPPAAAPREVAPVAPPSGPPTGEPSGRATFQLAEVQIAQKYFNDSQFTNRVRDVRKSLGRPKANVTKLIGADPRAIITISWDIIWYQYLVDLRRDIPTDERVVLHREGMDLEELTPPFREKNASIDDEGRLDASELEVKLLSDPTTLITEMSIEDEKALEDATEEIWDQKTAPEFKWDD